MKAIPKTLLGARIKKQLDKIKKTQTWLAEQVDLSPNAVSKWVKGTSNPTFDMFVRLPMILECKPGYLLGDEADETIAEVVRIMNEIAPEHRQSILIGVQAVAAQLPKKANDKKAA